MEQDYDAADEPVLMGLIDAHGLFSPVHHSDALGIRNRFYFLTLQHRPKEVRWIHTMCGIVRTGIHATWLGMVIAKIA